MLSDELAQIFNLPQPVGLLVQRIARGSPAEVMGLRAGAVPATVDGKAMVLGGDVLLAVDGIRIEDPASYDRIQQRMSDKRPGDTTTATILRGGQVIELSAALPAPSR